MNHLKTDFSSFADFLKDALGKRLNSEADSFIEMMAEDCIMEFPFAPANGVQAIHGRENLANYLGEASKLLTVTSFSRPTVHATGDPDVVILEFTCNGKALQTDKPYNQRYISVITLKDGEIVHYSDYWNPIVVMEALGALDNLKATESE